MIRSVLLLLIFSVAAFSEPFAESNDSSVDTLSGRFPNSWGLGFRVFGTNKADIQIYRSFSSSWSGLFAISNSISHSEDVAPGINYTDTNALYIQNPSKETMDVENISLWLQAQYEKPVGQGVDFTAAIGPRIGWTWSETENNGNGMNYVKASNDNSSTISGGLYATVGFKWWFVPKRLAIAGEMSEYACYSYLQSSSFSSLNEVDGNNVYYNSDIKKTYSLNSSLAIGLDVMF